MAGLVPLNTTLFLCLQRYQKTRMMEVHMSVWSALGQVLEVQN
jgi:hypothetical protein